MQRSIPLYTSTYVRHYAQNRNALLYPRISFSNTWTNENKDLKTLESKNNGSCLFSFLGVGLNTKYNQHCNLSGLKIQGHHMVHLVIPKIAYTIIYWNKVSLKILLLKLNSFLHCFINSSSVKKQREIFFGLKAPSYFLEKGKYNFTN